MTQETDENMNDMATDVATHRIDVLSNDSGEVVVAPTAEIIEPPNADPNPAASFASADEGRTATLYSDIFRLERARALREVAADEVTGEPAFEPGSIEAFADEDGRTMVVRVSLGELVKTIKAETEN